LADFTINGNSFDLFYFIVLIDRIGSLL